MIKMIYATAISFEKNDAKTVKKIVEIKLETDGNDSWTYKDKPINGWFPKERIHGWLKDNDRFEVKVNIYLYPFLEPVEDDGTKYVRSKCNNSLSDILLILLNYID